MKKTILTLAACLTASAFAEGEVVYVNIDRVYQDSEVTKAVFESIQSNFKEREDALRTQSDDIRNMNEEIEKEALTLSEEELDKKRGDLEKNERNFLRDRRALVEDRGVLLQERQRVINIEIAKIIEAIAVERKYSIVLNPFIPLSAGNRTGRHANFFYADKNADITSDVIERFDSEHTAAEFIE